MQFASFAIRTSRPSAVSKSSRNARPFRKVAFELRINPLRGLIEPGVPIPIVPAPPASCSARAIRSRRSRIAVS
jgi:hypothetical protein